MKKIGFLHSFAIFGIASILLIFETHIIIPLLSEQTGLEPVIFWFLTAGLGMFLPMLIFSWFILRSEGLRFSKKIWIERLRFNRMDKTDWQWAIGAIVLIGALSFVIMKILEVFLGTIDHQPPFMSFEPLTPGRYWILLIWFPYWLLNIMGEEVLWRGVILPRQELAFGKNAWLIHGLLWAIFHIAFGWQLLLMMLPILFIQSYVVQKRKNSWIGVIIHAVINGPSFILISFGIL